jgi:hypothetical protein
MVCSRLQTDMPSGPDGEMGMERPGRSFIGGGDCYDQAPREGGRRRVPRIRPRYEGITRQRPGVSPVRLVWSSPVNYLRRNRPIHVR